MRIAFILCDALRYDYYEKYMPGVREYADENVEYTNCNSMGPTTLTSLKGLLRTGSEYSRDDNLIRTLQSKGYKTTLIHSNPMLYKFYVFNEHLDTFREEYGKMIGWIKEHYSKTRAWEMIRRAVTSEEYARAESMLLVSKPRIESETTEDTFTWVHLMEAHIPWKPPNLEEFVTEQEYQRIHNKLSKSGWEFRLPDDEANLMRTLYAESVKYLDGELSNFLSDLDADLVIVTADHGDLLGEYGRWSHHLMYVPELLHVPLIIKNGERGSHDTLTDHRIVHKYLLGSARATSSTCSGS